MAIPELTRVFGQYGLYLRADPDLPSDLSGNMLASVLSLHRDGEGLAGQLCCQDSELPISSGSLSLVYCLFVFDSSPEPEALMREINRSLKPEGVALLIGWNPWSPARLRWPPGAGQGFGGVSLERLARGAGMELIRKQYLGPYWPGRRGLLPDQEENRWRDGFRAASLLVLRRREAGLTPLRKRSAAVRLRPGMSAG